MSALEIDSTVYTKSAKVNLKSKKLWKNWRITIKFHFENLSIFFKKSKRTHVLGPPSSLPLFFFVLKIYKNSFLYRTPLVAASELKSNPLSANTTKWSYTLKQFVGNLLENCFSMFDHFVKLVLKGLILATHILTKTKRSYFYILILAMQTKQI